MYILKYNLRYLIKINLFFSAIKNNIYAKDDSVGQKFIYNLDAHW